MHWNCLRHRWGSLHFPALRSYLPALLLILVASASCEQTGVLTLGTTMEGDRIFDITGMSGDGSVIVGTMSFKRTTAKSITAPFSTPLETQAFRWTAAGGIEPLGFIGPANFNTSKAEAISANGRVIIGESSSPDDIQPFRWTPTGRFAPLNTPPDSFARVRVADVSSDGSVVVGNATVNEVQARAFRWTPFTGYQILDVPFLLESDTIQANFVSDNGRVIVGHISDGRSSRIFRWTAGSGAVVLDNPTDRSSRSKALDLSGDGSTIVGFFGGTGEAEPFRWTQAEGFVNLGGLPGELVKGMPRATSFNGSVVVGMTAVGESDFSYTPFIWDARNGMRTILSLLSEEDAALLKNWRLESADLISADGRTIAGLDRNSEGVVDVWVVRLSHPLL
ncbi:MAG: hypothetical protein MI923_09285 [Phycisphaerales bacterium]|nr:hypothetical protein [Phycisphaerales bacterium]